MNRSVGKCRGVFAGLVLLAGSLVSTMFLASPAQAAGNCYFYKIDCTDPLLVQSWSGYTATKPCYWASFTAIAAELKGSGSTTFYLDLMYSPSTASADCNSAWGRIPSWNCSSGVCANYGPNPYPYTLRTQTNTTNTDQLPKSSNSAATYGRQLKDCCGGFVVKGGGKLYGTSGSPIVNAVTIGSY